MVKDNQSEDKQTFSVSDQEKLNRQLRDLLQKVAQVRRQAIEIAISDSMLDWVVNNKVNMLFSSLALSKLFCVGLHQDGKKLSIDESSFTRCGVLAQNDPYDLFVATRQKVWKCHNAVSRNRSLNGFERFYVPQQAWVTGAVRLQDLAVSSRGQIYFVNPLFSCVSTVSSTHSFVPVWKPAFVSELVSESRCFLSGIALEDDAPKYVTSYSSSDEKQGWKKHKSQGVLLDVVTNEVIASGLNAPRCPRVHDNKLWLLESASGYLGFVDTRVGRFERMAFVPGFATGLAFIGRYAVVSASTSAPTLGLTDSNEMLKSCQQKNLSPSCGIFVIDTLSGETVAQVVFKSIVTDITSLVILNNVKHTAIVGPDSEDMNRIITIATPKRRLAPSTTSRH